MKTVVMEAVALADVLKFSEEELTLLTNTDSLEKAFEKVTALYPDKLIIVTLGKDGALYHLEGKKDVIAGKALQPVDTTGAGDAFVGGLLAGLSQHPNWKENDVLVQSSVRLMPVAPLRRQQKGQCLRYQIKHN